MLKTNETSGPYFYKTQTEVCFVCDHSRVGGRVNVLPIHHNEEGVIIFCLILSE